MLFKIWIQQSLTPNDLYVPHKVMELGHIGSGSWWHQALIWNSTHFFAHSVSLCRNVKAIEIKIWLFLFKKLHLKMSSTQCWPFWDLHSTETEMSSGWLPWLSLEMWRQASTSPVRTRAVTLTTFPFLCVEFYQWQFVWDEDWLFRIKQIIVEKAY